MILQEMKDTNKFNQKLFSMSIEDLNNTKDLIADIKQALRHLK